jgi:hypothetical protein
MIRNYIPLTLFDEGERIGVRADLIVAVHDCPKMNLGIGSPPDSRSVVYIGKKVSFEVKETFEEIMGMIHDPLKLKAAVEAAQQMMMDFVE